MDPLGFEADEADFDTNLPTMDDKSSCLGTIRSSALFGWTGATGCALATGSPDSVSCMLCGVIFGWAKSPGLPTVSSCEMKTRMLVQILPAGRKAPVQRGLRALGGREVKDRLTVF
jgi:hypothetical protein